MKAMKKGFSRVDLLVLMFLASALCSFCMANIYYTEADVLKNIGTGCPGIKRVIKSERNFFAKSLITVETHDGIQVPYELDTNILYRYSYNFKTR